MQYFDCNCRYGFETVPPVTYSKTPDELLSEMDFNGINRALAVHSESFYDRPTPRPLAHDRLISVLNFLPFNNVNELKKDSLRNTIIKGHFLAVRFQPQKGRFSLTTELFAPQFLIMEELRLPLLLDLNQAGSDYFLDYDLMNGFLKSFPKLPVILMNTSYKIDTTLYPLMEKHANLHVETSGYQGFRCIEELAAHFGADRILFGSRYPYFYPAASRCRIETADLTTKQKEHIAYRNLEKLLEAVTYE